MLQLSFPDTRKKMLPALGKTPRPVVYLPFHPEKRATLALLTGRYPLQLLAGGVGSGCHGPNCGRPKTAAGVLKNYNWKMVQKTKLPNWSTFSGKKFSSMGTGEHTATLYKHPVHGQLLVNHSGGFIHVNKAGQEVAKPKGQFAKGVSEYLSKLHNGGVAVPPPVDLSKPPNGLKETYVSQKSGVIYNYNPKTGTYQTSVKSASGQTTAGNFTPSMVQKHVEMGNWKEAEQGNLFTQPPAGMQEKYVGVHSGDVYTFQPSSGKYHTPGDVFGDPAKEIADLVNHGNLVPETIAHHETGESYTWDKGSKTYKSDNNPNDPDIPKANIHYDEEHGMFTGLPDKPGKAPESVPSPWGGKPVVGEKPSGPKASPTVSTTAVPGSMQITPEQFTFKSSGSDLGGAHEKFIFSDHNGNDWLFKPATTLGGQPAPVMAHADEMASRIAQAIRPGYAIEAKAMSMNVPGKGEVFGSMQKMIPADKLRGEGGKFKDFTGRDFNTHPLQPWESKSLQQEQVLDWLISNHDSHGAQFLRTSGQYVGSRSVIGIDKTQAFKYFPNDKLSLDYHPNAMYGEKPPLYNQMMSDAKAGKLQLDPENALETIRKVEGISKNDYLDMLKGYANSRFGLGTSDAKTQFLDAALNRKENLRSDFEKFYGDVLGQKNFKFEPVYDEKARAVVNVAKGVKDMLADNEVRPNGKQTIQAALPALLTKYGGDEDKGQLSSSSISNWQKNYNKTDPTMDEAARWLSASKGTGLYPELAAKVGLLPQDLSNVKSAIGSWKGSTHGEGPSNIRASAQDILNDQANLKSRFSAALQVEHEVTKAKLGQMYPNGLIPELYRGLTGTVAQKLKDAKKSGAGKIEYAMRGAEGFSDSKGTGNSFGSGGVVLHAHNIPIQNIFSSYKTNPAAMSGYLHEQESYVAFPNQKMYLKPHEILTASKIKPKKIDANKTVYIDGTDQHWNSFPPDWDKKNQEPAEVIDVDIIPADDKPLQASGKVSKAEAEYALSNNPMTTCGLCTYWEEDGHCSRVQGKISEAGWCKFFRTLIEAGGPGSGCHGDNCGRKAGMVPLSEMKEVPSHISALRIPPAWTNVLANPDPNADLLAQGMDKKGQLQSLYSAKHWASAAASKFARVKAMEKEYETIMQQNKEKSDKEHADAVALIAHTGIRPGSDTDTKAEKQAYGATTLLGKHVTQDENGNISLQFTGKKGVALNIPVTDPGIAANLAQRASTAGLEGKLFNVSDSSLRDYVHGLDHGKFKPKDFRTLLANRLASAYVQNNPAPTDAKSYKRMVSSVAKAVSQRLGNTPTVALASYINPVVFGSWRAHAGV